MDELQTNLGSLALLWHSLGEHCIQNQETWG